MERNGVKSTRMRTNNRGEVDLTETRLTRLARITINITKTLSMRLFNVRLYNVLLVYGGTTWMYVYIGLCEEQCELKILWRATLTCIFHYLACHLQYKHSKLLLQENERKPYKFAGVGEYYSILLCRSARLIIYSLTCLWWDTNWERRIRFG